MHPYRLITPYFPLALPFIFVHRTVEANELSLLARPTLVCIYVCECIFLYFSLLYCITFGHVDVTFCLIVVYVLKQNEY